MTVWQAAHSPQPWRGHCSAAANARAATERPEPGGPVNSQAWVIAAGSSAARRSSATAAGWPTTSSQTLTAPPPAVRSTPAAGVAYPCAAILRGRGSERWVCGERGGVGGRAPGAGRLRSADGPGVGARAARAVASRQAGRRCGRREASTSSAGVSAPGRDEPGARRSDRPGGPPAERKTRLAADRWRPTGSEAAAFGGRKDDGRDRRRGGRRCRRTSESGPAPQRWRTVAWTACGGSGVGAVAASATGARGSSGARPAATRSATSSAGPSASTTT